MRPCTFKLLHRKIGADCFTGHRLSVFLSVRLSVQNLTFKLNISLLQDLFGMKAHLIDTHLLVPCSRLSAKVKVKYQGNISKKEKAVSGALVFHKHIFFLFVI